jgi:hypothetical protein
MLSSDRIDLAPVLAALRATGPWESISLAQFGDDFTDMLERLPVEIEVERHPSYPWPEVVSLALDHDLAIVVGNVNPGQLPSKAVQYLTLPIPRVAFTGGSGDALASYVRDLPGWLVVSPDDRDIGRRVAQHVGRDWSPEELRPPVGEAWPSVVEELIRFFERCTCIGGPRSGAKDPAVVASFEDDRL